MDTKHIRGAAAGADADLVSSFGQASHNHAESGSHTPIQNAHSHTFHSTSETGTTQYNSGGSDAIANDSHSHADTSSSADTGTNNSSTISIANTTNDPTYQKVIWLKSNGTPNGIPNLGLVFYDSDSLPGSWNRVNGDTYLKGADGSNGDGGATGGSATHVHSESGSHTHTQNSHTHSGASSPNDTQIIGGGAGVAAADGHNHNLDFNAFTPTNNASSVSFGSASSDLLFKKINIIQNNTGGDSLLTGMILLYLGSNASIPTDFTRYSAMDDFFPKGCSANGQVGTTGGSSSHNHTATCSTTSQTHTHTVTDLGGIATIGKGTGTTGAANAGHSHTWAVTSVAITHQNASLTINNNTSESHFPPYVKVIFVQYAPVSIPPFTVDSNSKSSRNQASLSARGVKSGSARSNLSFSKDKDFEVRSVRIDESGGKRQK